MIIIIGTGLAGYSVAKEFRKLNTNTAITLITQDDGVNYSKPLLSNALTKQKTPEALAMQDASTMADTLNARIITHADITQIDTTAHQVVLSNEILNYSQLVFATGARSIMPPLSGSGVQDIYTVNSLTDYRHFYPAVEQAEHIAIIGPGLIGCEFANDIANSGKRVTVIGPDKTPLSLLLPPEAGRALQAGLESLGVSFKLDVLPQSVEKRGNHYVISNNDGQTVDADLVLCATGLKPNTELAQTAGIDCDKAIMCDEYLSTNIEDVYALGDCASVQGHFLPYIMPIMHAARALAKTLAGNKTAVQYPAMPVMIKTPAHPIVVASPARDAQGKWHIEDTGNGIKARFEHNDELLGFVLTGDTVKEKQALSKALRPLMSQ